MTTSTFQQQVLQFLTTIPHGQVATYSQIASALGHPGAARAVGNILHRNPYPDKYPCYKVVNSKGRLACNFGCGGLEEQKLRLEADGIVVQRDHVDLSIYQMKTT